MANSNVSTLKCICGTEWKGIAANKIYDTVPGIVCDKCNKTVMESAIAYHCNNKQAAEHHDGYDLCEDCAIMININKNSEQTSDNNTNIDKIKDTIQKSLTEEINDDAENIISEMSNEEMTEMKKALNTPKSDTDANEIELDKHQFKEEQTNTKSSMYKSYT